jgi:hypothetical protein
MQSSKPINKSQVGIRLTEIPQQTGDITTTAVTPLNTTIFFIVEANSTYRIEGFLYGGCASGGGMRIQWSGLPSGANGIHSTLSFNVNTATNPASSVHNIGSVITAFAGASNVQQTRYVALLNTSSTGGTITLQFATGTAGQSSVFRALSSMVLLKDN